jgi:hypothetical protein
MDLETAFYNSHISHFDVGGGIGGFLNPVDEGEQRFTALGMVCIHYRDLTT